MIKQNVLNLNVKEVRDIIENKKIGEKVKSENGKEFIVSEIGNVKELGFDFNISVLSLYHINKEEKKIEMFFITFGKDDESCVEHYEAIDSIDTIRNLFMLKGYGDHLIEKYDFKEIGILPHQAIKHLRLRATIEVIIKHSLKGNEPIIDIVKNKENYKHLSDVIDFNKEDISND